MPVPLYLYGGHVAISVSLDGGLTFNRVWRVSSTSCAPPPSPVPPPPLLVPPNLPRVCWTWGDPHIVPFDGAQYDAHALGVRTLATWPAQSASFTSSDTNTVQLYSCPTRCDVGNAEWFPCGASSAVALHANVFGVRLTVAGENFYYNGIQQYLNPNGQTMRPRQLPGCDSGHCTAPRGRRSRHHSGPKLRLTFGWATIILTTWNNIHEHAGLVTSTMARSPCQAMPARDWSVCTGEVHKHASGAITTMRQKNWPVGLLDDLAGQCQSHNGTYIYAKHA